MPIRTVHAVLHELSQAKLVRRARDGWRLGRRSLTRFARLNGIATRLRDLVSKWRTERNALRALHNLPQIEYSTRNFTVAWPGIAPPSRAPTTPAVTREEQERAIGGGRADWTTDLEAGVIEMLRDVLGAELLPTSAERSA